jgi:hypothetical protein
MMVLDVFPSSKLLGGIDQYQRRQAAKASSGRIVSTQFDALRKAEQNKI